MQKVVLLILVIVSLLFTDSLNVPIIMNKCKQNQNIVAEFNIIDSNRLKQLNYKHIQKDTFFDTGEYLIYIPNENQYYVTKKIKQPIIYFGKFYNLVDYKCIDTTK